MVRLELDQVVMRRMREDDIEVVKALIKEGCEGTENRLILHILTRPLCLFILAVFSSILRCLVHSFILALAIPVFLLTVFLKITIPRSIGVLGSSRPYWDYMGSSYRGTQDETLQNPYSRISGKTPVIKRQRRRIDPKDKDKEMSEKVTPEREQIAGQVWVADCEGDILGCIFRENENRAGIRRICRLVTGSWYRREGLGRLLVQSLGALCPGLWGYAGTGEKRLSYSITWFCSWSPCANCSARLCQFLHQTPNLRLRIFVSRLYFFTCKTGGVSVYGHH